MLLDELIPPVAFPSRAEGSAFMKYLDRIANTAIIIAVVIFIIVVIRSGYLKPRPTAVNLPSSGLVGRQISLPGVRFPAEHDSLVLAISATCHFCKDSMPFYRELTAQAKGTLNVIAALPQPQAQAEAFVNNSGLTETKVVSVNLAEIGVYGTPTLLLVNDVGKVKAAWVGKQDEDGRRKILAAAIPGPSMATHD